MLSKIVDRILRIFGLVMVREATLNELLERLEAQRTRSKEATEKAREAAKRESAAEKRAGMATRRASQATKRAGRVSSDLNDARHRMGFLEAELRRAIRPEITRRFEDIQKGTL